MTGPQNVYSALLQISHPGKIWWKIIFQNFFPGELHGGELTFKFSFFLNTFLSNPPNFWGKGDRFPSLVIMITSGF